MSFCHEDNFFLNDNQNTPQKIRQSESLGDVREKCFFMKPMDEIRLNPDLFRLDLQNGSALAETHWHNFFNNIKIETKGQRKVELGDLQESYKSYCSDLKRFFLFLPYLLEWVGFIRPLRVRVADHGIVYRLSYLSTKIENAGEEVSCWDICLSSETLYFILKNEFGANTTHVNGRFSVSSIEARGRFMRFFSPQEYMKNGWGIRHPFRSLQMLMKIMITKGLRYLSV